MFNTILDEKSNSSRKSELSIARKMVRLGISVIPIKRKYPMPEKTKIEVVGETIASYKRRLPTDQELVKWFRDDDSAVGILCYPISGIVAVHVHYMPEPFFRTYFGSETYFCKYQFYEGYVYLFPQFGEDDIKHGSLKPLWRRAMSVYWRDIVPAPGTLMWNGACEVVKDFDQSSYPFTSGVKSFTSDDVKTLKRATREYEVIMQSLAEDEDAA